MGTAGGRVEHCIFILNYITNMTFEKRGKHGKPLYFAFIDFKKAYDSIDRKQLIEVLIEYKINPKIIDLTVQMYRNDHPIIKLGNMVEKIAVTGGIRQGCSISTLLFKLITFKVIEELRKIKKYKIGVYEDNSLWLADDATLIAEDLQTLEQLLKCLSDAGKKYGLQINKEKTKIMRVRGKDNGQKIDGYEMVNEATYLGITITGGKGRNIFQAENKKILDKAKKQVNTVMGEVRKSADKAIIGKAVWKQVSVPAILYGRAVVPTSKTLTENLQRKENMVWRHILGIGGYSAVASLRGEVGSSLMRTRIMDSNLQYVRNVLNGKFGNVKKMMEDAIKKKKGIWYVTVSSYLKELGITWDMLYTLTKSEIKTLTRHYDTLLWEKELKEKKILKYYKEGKGKMKYEFCYRNNINSMFLARARLNSLRLEEALGRGNAFYNKTCKLCKQEEEDLLHFVIECPCLERKRNYEIIDRGIAEPGKRLVHCLFKQRKYQKTGKMLKSMWYTRKNIIEQRKNRIKIRGLTTIYHIVIQGQTEITKRGRKYK